MDEQSLRDEARYIIETIRRICTTVGPGIPCSPQEHARASIIREEMEKAVGADSVTVEDFSCAPDAFLGWIRLGSVAALIAVVLHFLGRETSGHAAMFLAVVAFVSAFVILAAFVFQFAMCREFIDFLFPKKSSVNVIGRIASKTGKADKILIFSGHHDSAYEFTWASKFKIGYYVAVGVIFWGVITLSIKTGLFALGLATGNEWLAGLGSMNWLNLCMPVVPSILLAFFFLGSGRNGGTVPGAVDNLSGSMIAVSMGRILMRNPELIPENTEIRLVSFGCEEAGMRGAMRYVKAHLAELKEKDAELCNFETVADPLVTILTSDCNGLVRNSSHVVEGLAAAARSAGVPHRVKPFPFGGAGTDAYPFSAAGIKASCLLPVRYPWNLIRFYHQPADNWDILTPEPLINTLKIAIGWIGSGARQPR